MEAFPGKPPEWAGVIVRFSDTTFLALQMEFPQVRVEIERTVQGWGGSERPVRTFTDYDIHLVGRAMTWAQHHQQGRNLWVPQELEAGRKVIDQ